MKKRLSQIETLPEAFTEELQWLFDAIKRERVPQTTMHEAFNLRLAAKGHPPISMSAFNRHAVRVRGGDIRRPLGVGSAAENGDDIFTREFRKELVSRIGESAVRAQEAALSALLNTSS